MNNIKYPNPYPIDAFHNIVRDAVYEVGRCLQAPDALIANSFLTAMSIACQSHVDVQLPPGPVCPVPLYIATIAESGERKTAVDNLVCAPIYDHDTKKAKAYKSMLAEYRAAKHFWSTVDTALQQRVRSAVKSGRDLSRLRDELMTHNLQEPSKPVSGTIIHENITESALMNALRGNGKAIAIMSNEGANVLDGGAMNNFGGLNKAWDGAKVIVLDRAYDHVAISNPRVTVSFMVQAHVFRKFIDKGANIARASGHLARYLVADPASTQGTRSASLQEPTWEALHVFHNRVTELLEAAMVARAEGGKSRSVLSFSPEAKERWVWIQNEVERRIGLDGDLSSVRDFASKFMEIMSRVAAIFHHFTSQEGNTISLETLNRALDVTTWHLDEFKRLFGDANDEPQLVTDSRKLLRYLYLHVWCRHAEVIPRNDVRQGGPVRQRGRFEAALDHLCRENSIWVGPTQGRRKLFVFLNPNIFQQLSFQ